MVQILQQFDSYGTQNQYFLVILVNIRNVTLLSAIVHFKSHAIKFSSILCFANVDFDITFVNRL
jgi:hypothetical protein